MDDQTMSQQYQGIPEGRQLERDWIRNSSQGTAPGFMIAPGPKFGAAEARRKKLQQEQQAREIAAAKEAQSASDDNDKEQPVESSQPIPEEVPPIDTVTAIQTDTTPPAVDRIESAEVSVPQSEEQTDSRAQRDAEEEKQSAAAAEIYQNLVNQMSDLSDSVPEGGTKASEGAIYEPSAPDSQMDLFPPDQSFAQPAEDDGFPPFLQNQSDELWAPPGREEYQTATPETPEINEDTVQNRSASKTPLSITMTVLVCIAALFYAAKGISWVPRVIGSVLYLIGDRFYNLIPRFLFIVLTLVKTVSYAGMAALLAALGFQREEKLASTLQIGEGLAGIVIVVDSLLIMLNNLVFYQYFEPRELMPIIPAALCFGGTAVMLSLMGLRPFSAMTDSETGFSVGAVLAVTVETLSSLRKPKKAPVQSVGATVPTASATVPAVQTAPSNLPAVPAYNSPQVPAQTPDGAFQPMDGAAQPVQTGVQMERLSTNRSLLIVILLGAVTAFIYYWYFQYKMAKDLNIACQGDGDETPGLIKFLVFGFLTCGIYMLYWHYKVANRVFLNAKRYGLQIAENGSSFLTWILIGMFTCSIGSMVAYHTLYKNVNRLCDAYNQYNGLY